MLRVREQISNMIGVPETCLHNAAVTRECWDSARMSLQVSGVIIRALSGLGRGWGEEHPQDELWASLICPSPSLTVSGGFGFSRGLNPN